MGCNGRTRSVADLVQCLFDIKINPEKKLSVNKQFLKISVALAILLPTIHSWAQSADVGIRRASLIACDPPVWTQEALRYELEGTTVLQHDVDDDGRPSSVRVARSSGWKVLDHMAIRAMASCRFSPSTDPQVVRNGLKTPYNWQLTNNDQIPLQAALVAGSCPPSAHLGEFLAFTGKVKPRQDAILVRFLLDEKGNPFGIKVEETDPAPLNMATAFINSCRFSPATLEGRPVRGNLSGWLTLK